MFSTLHMFAQVICPDVQCERSPCLFSHDPSKTTASHGQRSLAIARTNRGGTSAGQSSSISATINESQHRLDSRGSVQVRASPAPAAKRLKKPVGPPQAPSLDVNVKLSRQNIADRKKALQRLFEEFYRLYDRVIPLDSTLPASSALAQELETAAATQKNNYNQAIHAALVRIRGRTHPEDISSPYIGTVKDSQAKELVWQDEQASRLTPDRVRRYLLPRRDFALWGYMDAVPVGPGHTEPDAIGQSKACDRCRQTFVVSGTKDYSSMLGTSVQGDCRHHWGRTVPERVDGQRVWLYTCCKEPRGSAGCSDALHVFKDGKDTFKRVEVPTAVDVDEEPEDLQLHKRVGFRTTAHESSADTGPGGSKGGGVDSSSPASGKRKHGSVRDIVALDCEMIYTTGGMALARVSVTDEDGKLILDEIVKQHNVVFDLNTRFSGLRAIDMDKAEGDIWAIRRKLCKEIGPETIIVGHGLENDLKALRLVHQNVIDTAVLFPHIRGPPFRRALRDITTEKLGVFIQTNIEQEGHDSAADARAALDLVKWLVKKDVGA